MKQQSPSSKAVNFAIDSTEDEFKPSKFSRLSQYVIDELRKAYNIDPTGEAYTVVIATSHDKGQSFKICADSTDDQKMDGVELWSQKMVEKEVRAMKLNEVELINQAKAQLSENPGPSPNQVEKKQA